MRWIVSNAGTPPRSGTRATRDDSGRALAAFASCTDVTLEDALFMELTFAIQRRSPSYSERNATSSTLRRSAGRFMPGTGVTASGSREVSICSQSDSEKTLAALSEVVDAESQISGG